MRAKEDEMGFEKFGEKQAARKAKSINQMVERLLTNGQGQKGTRLIIWNDNAQKYFDLGGWGRASIQSHLESLYDSGYSDGLAESR